MPAAPPTETGGLVARAVLRFRGKKTLMSPQPESRPVVVGLFDSESSARGLLHAVRALGLTEQQCGVVSPGQTLNVSNASPFLASALAAVAAPNDLTSVLVKVGVPEGEARFYADEARQGRTLVIVNANGRSDEVRKLVLDHGGWDVQSRGAEFIRGDGAGVSGGVGAAAPDITQHWEDFRSRYEMLWQQHYGTTDATWEQMEPVYRYAWDLANDPRYRGRPWGEVETTVSREWQRSTYAQRLAWRDAAGPVRDVWEDVAQEALTGAEGGADRRIPTAGTDQAVAARDVLPPRGGAA
jgi:hypothetical protein